MLRESILKKDPAAASLARRMGPSANPEIIELTRSKDAKVRRIALNCLNQTGGSDAVKAMIDALSDDDPQVRAAALRGLQNHPDASAVKLLLRAWASAPDHYVRQQIPLIAGKIPGVSARELRNVCGSEGNPDAREGCITALAKLGDAEAREEFAQGLQASKGQVRRRYLDYCKYIHQPWLVKPLAQVLDDTSAMIRTGVDAEPDVNQYLRACDIAVNLIAEIGGIQFSFPVDPWANYRPEQIEEVKRRVAALP